MATEPPVETPAPPAPPSDGGMVGRIKGILLNPAGEWAAIADEATSTNALYTKWVAPLALIGPLALAIGMLSMGYRVLGISVGVPMSFIIASAVALWVTTIAAVFALGLAIDALAPSFGAEKNALAAHKVAAYGATAALLAGIFHIVLGLGFLVWLVSLYSAYLIFVGVPVLMKPAADKAAAYGGVSAAIGAVLYYVAWYAAMQIAVSFMPIPRLII